jgi:hypothetical protein
LEVLMLVLTNPKAAKHLILTKALIILGIAAAFVSFGCASKSSDRGPTNGQASQISQPQETAKASPPRLSEVEDAVKRVFKDAAVIAQDHNPNFVVGDFNGDRSTDVAVIVKVAPGKTSQMNQQFPPWILKDPFVTALPGMAPLRVAEGETLLAVIHGYGSEGWRDPQATQTYLLKHALGERMEARSKEDVIASNQGKKLPRLRGDLISEILRGKSGYLYYAVSTYSWYDPTTFKGEAVMGPVHGSAGRN